MEKKREIDIFFSVANFHVSKKDTDQEEQMAKNKIR